MNKPKYRVEVYECKANVPFSLAKHSWIVTYEKDKPTRYEVLFFPNKDKSFGHLHVNFLSPKEGIYFFPFHLGPHFKAKKIGEINGNSKSSAKRMINLIKKSKSSYPYLKEYHLLGPNSNTYVQHILSHFPESKIKLSNMAIGKDYENKL